MAHQQQTTDYVTLISSDGFEFKILRSAACKSEVIRKGLSGHFKEAHSNVFQLHELNGVILEKVCEYLYYNEKYQDQKDVPDMDLPPELCLELLMAADFLGGECVRRYSRGQRVVSAIQYLWLELLSSFMHHSLFIQLQTQELSRRCGSDTNISMTHLPKVYILYKAPPACSMLSQFSYPRSSDLGMSNRGFLQVTQEFPRLGSSINDADQLGRELENTAV